MRYERKYRIEYATRSEVEQTLRLLPHSFQTAFPDRRINSIYLDTPNLQSLSDNLAGISNRKKFRIRWYGEDYKTAKKPKLETKIKANQLGKKENYKLPDFQLTENFNISDFLQKNSPLSPVLKPVVLVQYSRSYFTTFDQKVRATVDSEINFYSFNGNLLSNSCSQDTAIILEVKYDRSLDSEIDNIFQKLPFRLSKNSKFVGGMTAYYL